VGAAFVFGPSCQRSAHGLPYSEDGSGLPLQNS